VLTSCSSSSTPATGRDCGWFKTSWTACGCKGLGAGGDAGLLAPGLVRALTRPRAFTRPVNSDRGQNGAQQFHHQDGWRKTLAICRPNALWPPRTATPATVPQEDMGDMAVTELTASWCWRHCRRCRCRTPTTLAAMRALISTSTSVAGAHPIGLGCHHRHQYKHHGHMLDASPDSPRP
jgi:hypothetical protein